MNLDDVSQLREIDAHDFLREVDELPDQVEQAWGLAQSQPLPAPERYRDVQQVIIAGMGGSGIGGALAQAYAAAVCRVPITLVRDDHLPAWAGPRTLVIACSHSGETEETLSASQAALAAGAPLWAITRGGRLATLAEAAGQMVWRFEHAGQPRSAVGYLLMLALGGLARLGLIPDPAPEVSGAVLALRAQQQQLRAEVPVTRNPAKRMAGQFMERVPLIIGADHLAPVARRWKTQINEVAKALAVYDELPELDHNSVAGTLYPDRLVEKHLALFLRSSFEQPRQARRAEVAREIYMTAGFNTDAVEAVGPSRLAHMLTSLHYGDYTAFYLAICYGIDPSPVPQIDYLKQQLLGQP